MHPFAILHNSKRNELANIGDVIFGLDYRFGAQIQNDGSVDKLRTLYPVASNYGFSGTGQSDLSKCLTDFGDDGFGFDSPGFDPEIFYYVNRPISEPLFGQRFLGTDPYVIFTVGKKDSTGDTTNAALSLLSLRNAANTATILNFRPFIRQGTLILRKGSEIETSSSNTLPNNEFNLITQIYYGAGSNNVRQRVKTSETISTNSAATITDGAYGAMFQGLNITVSSTSKFRWKTSWAYNMAGKTPTEINAFCVLFENTLKQESVYATLPNSWI